MGSGGSYNREPMMIKVKSFCYKKLNTEKFVVKGVLCTNGILH